MLCGCTKVIACISLSLGKVSPRLRSLAAKGLTKYSETKRNASHMCLAMKLEERKKYWRLACTRNNCVYFLVH